MARRQGFRRYHSSLYTDILRGIFEHVSVSLMKFFFVIKSKTSGLGNTLFECQIIRISGLSDVGLKEFWCI